jgi:hypothetical protein
MLELVSALVLMSMLKLRFDLKRSFLGRRVMFVDCKEEGYNGVKSRNRAFMGMTSEFPDTESRENQSQCKLILREINQA